MDCANFTEISATVHQFRLNRSFLEHLFTHFNIRSQTIAHLDLQWYMVHSVLGIEGWSAHGGVMHRLTP